MFHSFDKAPENPSTTRAQWMALLARAPHTLMQQALLPFTTSPPVWLRKPETGLMMVQGRIGGTGERFNLGEMTVTRCALRLTQANAPTAVGVSYVIGRDHRQARLAALADALLQDPTQYPDLEISLLNPVREHLLHLQAKRHQQAQSTKVDFLTVAREAGGEDEGDEA